MSSKHPDYAESDSHVVKGSATDDYTHPGWNPRQAVTVACCTGGAILGILTAQCTKSPDAGSSFKQQDVPTQVVPENPQLY